MLVVVSLRFKQKHLHKTRNSIGVCQPLVAAHFRHFSILCNYKSYQQSRVTYPEQYSH